MANVSARRSRYLKSVTQFIMDKGPRFVLKFMEDCENSTQHCHCCGYKNIRLQYHVQNARGEEFIIGSECQSRVLGAEDADLSAEEIRTKLTICELVVFGARYGLDFDLVQHTSAYMPEILKARKVDANRRAWKSRKAKVQSKQLKLAV